MAVRYPNNEIINMQGAYMNYSQPHRVFPSMQNAATAFYYERTVDEEGNPAGFGIIPAIDKFPENYPFGPIYPNPMMYQPSVPGKIDISFGYRPFL